MQDAIHTGLDNEIDENDDDWCTIDDDNDDSDELDLESDEIADMIMAIKQRFDDETDEQ